MPDITTYDPRSPMGIGVNPAVIAGYKRWKVDLYAQEKGIMWDEAGITIGGVSAAFRMIGPLYIGAQGLIGGYINTSGISGGGRIGLGVRFYKNWSLGISGDFFRTVDDKGNSLLHKALDLGLLIRPGRFVNLGASFVWDWNPRYNHNLAFRAGLGIMPTGDERFSFGLDLEYPAAKRDLFRLGAVCSARVARGVDMGLRVNMIPGEGKDFRFGAALGIRVAFGAPELFASGGFSGLNQSETVTFGVSIGPDRAPDKVVGHEKWVIYDIRGLNLACTGPFSVDCSMIGTLRDLDALSRIKGVKGVLLRVGACPKGMGDADLIATAIERLKQRKLKVIVATGMCGPAGFAAFSGADRVYLVPGTASPVIPAGRRLVFLGDLFNNLGVKAQYVATGRYKTFPLMFTRNSPSKDQRDMWEPMLKDRCQTYVDRVNRLRGTRLECGPGSPVLYSAKRAVSAGLADGLTHMDSVVREIENQDPDADFMSWPIPLSGRAGLDTRPKIAIIPIIGDIVPGRGIDLPFGNIHLAGAASITRLIDRAVRDSSTRGILIYIDSPGGDLAASEIIHHAIKTARKTRPVAVLFGNVAASGGYYISTAGSVIFAPPETVTGSIGVFLLRFSILDLLAKLGVTTFPVPAGRDTGLFSFLSAQNESAKPGMKRLLNDAFDLFIRRVRAGRGEMAAKWAKKAGAMVVNGKKALKTGLIDRVGGMSDALDFLKKRADLSDFRVSILRPPTLIEKIASGFRLFGMAAFKTIGSAVQAVLARSVSGVVSARLPYVDMR